MAVKHKGVSCDSEVKKADSDLMYVTRYYVLQYVTQNIFLRTYSAHILSVIYSIAYIVI